MNGLVRHVRRLALLRSGDGPTDRELLQSFLTRRDETAFEALLRRHGPLVLGVCRRVPGFDGSNRGHQCPSGEEVALLTAKRMQAKLAKCSYANGRRKAKLVSDSLAADRSTHRLTAGRCSQPARGG